MPPTPTLYVQPATAPVITLGMALLLLLIIREMVWKGIALWKAGTKKQMAWFVCMFIFNTAGILPILYLAFRQEKEKKGK